MSFAEVMNLFGETLLMTLISTLFAYLLGVPAGVVLYITSKKGLRPCRWVNLILGFVVNVLRSIPCLILVVISLPVTRIIFGRGTGAWYTMLIPLIICAFGFVARLVEQSLSEVPAGEIEAIKSLGASNWQLVYKVLLPEAKTALISGLAVALVAILGYTSFAYNIGAGGLIAGIWDYYATHTGSYTESGIFWILILVVILMVQLIQELGLFISRKIDKRSYLK